MKKTILTLLILVSSYALFAQGLQVKGIVTSKEDGQPIPGVTVVAKGTTIGVITDFDGNYSLNVSGTATLQFSFVGMKSQEVPVNNQSVINIVLASETTAIDEVVVVGYGVQKVTKVSGAISSLKGGDIEKQKAVRTEDVLQGRASGVTVVGNGTPGSKPTVLIRGIPSFSGTDPVVIIDGIPQTLNDLNSINSSDIESINVLKDAATTAIYGVKGGNGVIVVTTKSGKKDQNAEINLSSNYGFQEVVKTIGMLNATEFGAIINEGSVASGGNLIFPDLSVLGKGTNWQDEIFQSAPMQSHNISASGGGEKMSYFLSSGYLSQGGIVGGYDKSRFNRINFTANMTFDLTPKLKFLLNTSYANIESKGIAENAFNSVIGSALNFDPTVPVLNTTNTVGKYGYSNLLLSEIFNPLTKLADTYNNTDGNKLSGKFEFQYQILKNLKLTTRYGYVKYDELSKKFTPLSFYGPQNVNNTMDASGNAITGSHNSVEHNKKSDFNFTYETFGNYNFSIAADHHFDTVLGIAISKSSGNNTKATRQDVPYNSWDFADFTAATGVITANNFSALGGDYYQYFRKNLSYFSRINYDYNDRYLASLSIRRDGSYAFGKDNKFGNFYSGSLGWVASEESFFHSKTISYLKIRGSIGTIGNENVNPQSVTITTGGPSYGPTANSNGYTFGNVFYPGSTVNSAANDKLMWEKQIQANFGFDMNLFKDKLTISADYFQKSVSGLLFTPSASLYLGTVPIPTDNIGSTKSSGIDMNISYKGQIAKKINLNTSVSFTTSKNEVTATNDDGTAKILGGSYFNGQSQNVTVFEKGHSPGYFYGYKTAGLFQNAAEIASWATQDGAQPGDIKFVDVNKDGKITALDKTEIGNPYPKFTIGWNLNLDYKGIDLVVFTYASIGNDIYMAFERNANYTNKFRSVLSRWTGENTTNSAKSPRYSFTDDNSNIRVSDRYVEDGSFVKIKNIQLGYTFSQATIHNLFKKVRVYAQVKNAFTFTKYSGYDPEISSNGAKDTYGILETGIDRGAYPQARTYSLGLDIKF
jgi:TonB-linked SusC/RagA family outer membrane protein